MVVEFLLLIPAFLLAAFRSFGKAQLLSFASPDTQWKIEYRLYIVIALLFIGATVVWAATCLQKTNDFANELQNSLSDDPSFNFSFTTRPTGYAFHDVMMIWMLILVCLMLNAKDRGMTWLAPFAQVVGGQPQGQPPVATTVAYATPMGAPVGQPEGQTYGQPVAQPYGQPGQPYGQPMAYAAAPGQPVVYAAPTDQYGQPVMYGAPVYAQGQPTPGGGPVASGAAQTAS